MCFRGFETPLEFGVEETMVVETVEIIETMLDT